MIPDTDGIGGTPMISVPLRLQRVSEHISLRSRSFKVRRLILRPSNATGAGRAWKAISGQNKPPASPCSMRPKSPAVH